MNDISKAMLLSKIRAVEPSTDVKPKDGAEKVQGQSFESILFSKHAEKRLHSRGLAISDIEQSKLEGAVSTLEKKGAKDSLVLMGELAFIVNVPSKTVVTALSKEQMKEQVFTNIDSTILV